MSRGQGTLTLSCNPHGTLLGPWASCAGWLFGGSVGLDTESLRENPSHRQTLTDDIQLAVPDPAPDVVGVAMSDLWYIDGGRIAEYSASRYDNDFARNDIFHYHGPASMTYLNNAGTPLIKSRFTHPRYTVDPVSYTHLTLPTILLV